MKKQLIFAGLTALVINLNAQFVGAPGPLNANTRVRVGGSLPAGWNTTFHVGDGIGDVHFGTCGMVIKPTLAQGGRALLELQEPYNTNTLVIQALSDKSYISNLNQLPLIIQSGGGNVGIGTSYPDGQSILHVNNDVAVAANGARWATKSIITQVIPAFAYHPFIGIEGSANTYYSGQSTMYGVIGSATNGQSNTGGDFTASGNGAWYNVGVHATAYGNSNANYNWAARFDGPSYTTANAWTTSDRKLKDEIKPLTNALDKVMLLKPSTYFYKMDERFKDLNLPREIQMGLIAQDLEEVFPELVREMPKMSRVNEKGEKVFDTPEFKTVQYGSLIPLLIAGMQEQQSVIETLTDKISKQDQLISELSQKVANTTGIDNFNPIETGFQMSQNEPNPFTHETVVKYTLPQTVSNAFMAVYDLTGKQITTFPIDQKGSSSVTLTSEKLAAGIYIYSIVADGKVVDSKRMIVAEK